MKPRIKNGQGGISLRQGLYLCSPVPAKHSGGETLDRESELLAKSTYDTHLAECFREKE